MNTEQPHYGNEALAHNDAENWRAYCASERTDGIIGWSAVLLIVCALCFYL